MQNLWLSLKQEIAKQLDVSTEEIEEPEKYGDFAYPCFNLAKKLKKDPKEIAKELAKKIKIEHIKKIEVAGPYVNFYIDWKIFNDILLSSVNEKYGFWDEKENVVIDTFQPNPFKSFHIGHVRNAVLGESIRRLLEFMGKKVFSVAYTGDVGTHVAKWLWYFQNFYKGEIPQKNFSKWAGKIYAEASKKMEEKEEYKEQVDELNRKIDKRDLEIMKIWKKMRDLCYEDFWKIKDELEVRLEEHFPESICEEPGKKWVLQLFNEGKIEKSEGAIVIDLQKYGLGVFILLKSDGTAIYATKDIGLLYWKNKNFKYDKSLFVVGSEQDYYFKQLFKTYEILKLPGWDKSKHISYDLVTLKEEKMASRLGNVIPYEDVRDEMTKKVLEEMEKKNLKLENKEKIAKQIALGAIKFQMLLVENNKLIKFDWKEALDIEGKSGPYLQYTLVRASSILKKEKVKNYDASLLKEDIEIELIKKIAKFPNTIKQAAYQYSPNILTNYLFELAQDFNSFYQTSPVLKSEENLKNARLKLVDSVKTVLETGLELLGIPILEKM